LKQKIKLEIEPKARKKNPPRTAFKKGEPNPHAFRPGVSPCPGGKPKSQEQRLLSHTLRIQLAWRAPDKVARALGLPRGASWSMVLAQSLLRRATAGDLQAAQLIVTTTEGTKSRIDFFAESDVPRNQVTVVFEESDGDGHRRLPTTLDGFIADDDATNTRQIESSGAADRIGAR
jgi:hypothetical protein